MEPDLVRDAAIVAVLGVMLLAAGVPLRWALLILAVAVGANFLIEAVLDELTSTG